MAADRRNIPPGTFVTCEHCPTPHPLDDEGTRCKFPKPVPGAAPAAETPPPAEDCASCDDYRERLAESRAALAALRALDPRDAVIAALHRACPFSPGDGCRRCRVCDAAEQVRALPAGAALSGEGRTP